MFKEKSKYKYRNKRESKSTIAYNGGIKNGSNLYGQPLPSGYAGSLVIYLWL